MIESVNVEGTFSFLDVGESRVEGTSFSFSFSFSLFQAKGSIWKSLVEKIGWILEGGICDSERNLVKMEGLFVGVNSR